MVFAVAMQPMTVLANAEAPTKSISMASAHHLVAVPILATVAMVAIAAAYLPARACIST